MNVLVINTGSSSIKVKIIDVVKKTVVFYINVEGISQKTSFINVNSNIISRYFKNHDDAIREVISVLKEKNINFSIVAHRFVHGGSITKPLIINAKSIRFLRSLNSLAPLHNPNNLKGIVLLRKYLPKIRNVAVFDTQFHTSIPDINSIYAIPKKFITKYGLKRYGFHGLSYEYITYFMKNKLKKRSLNLIVCHLGNGASICAIKNNKSINTSMGFSPLVGLAMGTRSGDIDPGIIEFMHKNLDMDLDSIMHILNKESGLKALTGKSDMRLIYSDSLNNSLKARFALDYFSKRISEFIAKYFVDLQNVDGIVFTGGIGENAFYVRKKVVGYLKFLGVKLDSVKNRKNAFLISSDKSCVDVYVVKTNEELMIALNALKVVK